MQVDKEMNASTPILINTEFADSLDEKIKMFLGFGHKSGYEHSLRQALNLCH